MWKNLVEPYRSQVTTIRRMRIACWLTVATNTHSAYVILTDFSRQLVSRTRVVALSVLCLSCSTRVIWNACFRGLKRVFEPFTFAIDEIVWKVTRTIHSCRSIYYCNISPFGRGMSPASDVRVPTVLHGTSNLTRERRDTSPIGRLTHCFHDVIVWRSSASFIDWRSLPLSLTYCVCTSGHGANRFVMHAFRNIKQFVGVDAKKPNPKWLESRIRRGTVVRSSKRYRYSNPIKADSHIPCRSPATILPFSDSAVSFVKVPYFVLEVLLLSPSSNYLLLNCYHNLYAVNYTVGPWLTNLIRSRGLVVTQVGRKSRLFFP
jgi:hypothetical protein